MGWNKVLKASHLFFCTVNANCQMTPCLTTDKRLSDDCPRISCWLPDNFLLYEILQVMRMIDIGKFMFQMLRWKSKKKKWQEEPQNKRNIIIFFFLQDYLAMWQGKEKKVTMHMNEENLFCSFLLAWTKKM